MNNDVFSDLTGLSAGPKPMRANKAPGLKQQKNVHDLLAPQTNGLQSTPQAAQTAVHDLSDLEQIPSAANTPEPSTDAFDLFSDLALPSGDDVPAAGAAPVLVEDPQAPALPEVEVQEQPRVAKKQSNSKSPQWTAKPKPATAAVSPPEEDLPPPPAYNELMPGDMGPPPSAIPAIGSNESLSSPAERAPTVFIHVDDDPGRFPYHEPPPLPKPTPPRTIPKRDGHRRTPSQTSSSGVRGSPTAAGVPKRRTSASGRSPPKRTSSTGRSPTRITSVSSGPMPSLLDGSSDVPLATISASADTPPPVYNDIIGTSFKRTSTLSSTSSNARSVLPPTADLLSDFGTPGDLLSTPDPSITDPSVSASPSPEVPVATSRKEKRHKPPTAAAPVATADLLGGSFANLPEASGDLLGGGDLFSGAGAQRSDVLGSVGPIDDVFGLGSASSGTTPGVSIGVFAAEPMDAQVQVGVQSVGFDDDFFTGGGSSTTTATTDAPTQPGASDADWLNQLGGGSSSSLHGRAAAAKPGREGSRKNGVSAPAAAGQAGEAQDNGDVLLQNAIANAQAACMSLSQERVGRIQGAIAQAHEYVAEKLAEKQLQVGKVTEEGLHFATLSASKTAASILTKTVEHHQHEAQQEADVAEAFEYRDSIKADIKAWAFQGGTRRGLRNLLTSLDKVLWEGAKWKCINLADVSTDAQVKKVLNKARLLLHTDKMARQPEKIRLRAELILIEIDKALKGVA